MVIAPRWLVNRDTVDLTGLGITQQKDIRCFDFALFKGNAIWQAEYECKPNSAF
jgi:hypothetical protein